MYPCKCVCVCRSRWGLQAWDTLQDSTGNSSIDKADTSLDWQGYFSQLQDTTDALPCHIHLYVCLWIMDPHSRAPKKNTSHGNEVLPQDTTHLIQRPCYQRGGPCQDPVGNRTTWRSLDDQKETQTTVVWSCLPFIRSGRNHLSKHSERGKKTRRTKEEVGRQHQGMDRPGVQQVPEGSGEQGKMEKTGLWNHLWCSNDPRGWGIDDDLLNRPSYFPHDPVGQRMDVLAYARNLLMASCRKDWKIPVEWSLLFPPWPSWSKSGHSCPCQNCCWYPPTGKKTGRGYLLNCPSYLPDDPTGQGTGLN